MKNLKFFVIIFLDELGLLLSILGFFKDFLEISLISLISANLPLPISVQLHPKFKSEGASKWERVLNHFNQY